MLLICRTTRTRKNGQRVAITSRMGAARSRLPTVHLFCRFDSCEPFPSLIRHQSVTGCWCLSRVLKTDSAREHKPERARRLQRCHIHPLSSSLQVCWICMGGFGRCHKHDTTLNRDRTLASTTCSRLSQSLSHWCCTLTSSDSHTGCRQLQTVSQDITNDMGATTRRRSQIP